MLNPPTLKEDAPPPPPIDAKVRAAALEKIRAILRGNGVRPETVEIKSADAQTLSYEAQAYVRLTTRYTSKTLPGKIDKGEAIGSPQAFEAAMKNMALDAQKNAAKRQTIIDIVLKRPDKGYGARDQIVALESLSRDFVSHEGCQTCQTTGKATCPRCGGEKFMTCQTCHGRQNILCPGCRGTGQIVKGGRSAPCPRCQGRMRVQCPACRGQGRVKCKGCNGAGAVSCATCKATGFLSHLAHVELVGHLHFDFNRQGLPRELSKLLDAFSLRYIEKKDIDLVLLTGEWQENEPPENIPIGYSVTVPYGEVTFSIPKRRDITCTILGQNGEPTKGPDFLDDTTKGGQADLQKAARGQGNIGAHLRAAARFRLLRECIIASASRAPQREALGRVAVKYPVGISPEKILRLMTQAHDALRIIARKPRLIGLAAGLALHAALSGAYFLSLRKYVIVHLLALPVRPSLALAGIDATTVAAGTVLGVFGAWFLSGRVLKETLRGLASPAAIQSLRPKIGWTLGAAFALSLAVTAAFYLLAARL